MIWAVGGEGKEKEREEKRREGLLGHVLVLVHWRWVDEWVGKVGQQQQFVCVSLGLMGISWGYVTLLLLLC